MPIQLEERLVSKLAQPTDTWCTFMSLVDLTNEHRIRTAAFDYLRAVVDHDGVATWKQLKSFEFEGESVFLVGSGNGIFKPRQLEMPISILTARPRSSSEAPYEDEVSDDDFLLYRYRGTDPQQWENARLRQLMQAGLPLIYLHGIDQGLYLASAALIVDDDPDGLTFMAVLADLDTASAGTDFAALSDRERGYQVRLAKQRVHQSSFRRRVLKAYKSSCALCRLRHPELLDAAHIIRDADGGQPVVPNGLALCKIHHAAYDTNIIGIRPDLVAQIRVDILAERDGPMLAHGLQDFHGVKLWTPRGLHTSPDESALEQRYAEFQAAS
jgi:putative restriction endonuclease